MLGGERRARLALAALLNVGAGWTPGTFSDIFRRYFGSSSGADAWGHFLLLAGLDGVEVLVVREISTQNVR